MAIRNISITAKVLWCIIPAPGRPQCHLTDILYLSFCYCLQDVELYLTKQQREGGFTLVARVGRMLQELLVDTALSKDDMKKALTRVLSRVR